MAFFALGIAFLSLSTVTAATMSSPQEAYQFYLKALLYESQGNLAFAQEELNKAIALAPASDTLYKTAAELAFRQGRSLDAMAAAEKAIELNPGNYKLYILAGQIYWSAGVSDKAEERLGKAVELAPNEAEPLMNLAMAVTPRDPRRAIGLYNEYLVRHPGEVDIRERVAQLHQSLGEVEKAKETWEKALEWAPDSLKAHLALAQIAEVHEDTSTAIRHYEAVLAQDPNNLPILLRIGELRYRGNEMTEAYEAFSKAQMISPESASASFWLALLHEQKGEWGEAIKLLEQVAVKAPDTGVLLRLSYYYSQARQNKKSIAILKKLSAEEPENADFLNYLSLSYEEDKQFPQAEKTLQKLLVLLPQDPEVYFHLATVYDRMKRHALAEEALKKAIALKPDFPVALNYLGYTYADRNVNLEAAEQLVMNAIALDPANGAYLDSMGWVYYRMGKFQKAEDFLQQAILQVKDPLIYEHLGDVQAARGEGIAAVLTWDESLRLQPGQKKVPARIDKALEKLDNKDKLSLYLKRSAHQFSKVQSVRSLLVVKIGEKKPYFTCQAQMSYDQKGPLIVELPGPLSGPLLRLEKLSGEPAKVGAIHPLLQSVEPYVKRAAERLESVFSAELFRAFQKSEGGMEIQEKKGLLVARWLGTALSFKKSQGALQEIVWSEEKPDALRFSPSRRSKPSPWPPVMEWVDLNTNFRIRLEFVSPVFSFGSTKKDEKGTP